MTKLIAHFPEDMDQRTFSTIKDFDTTAREIKQIPESELTKLHESVRDLFAKGNADIGLPIDSKSQAERYACYEMIRSLINIVSDCAQIKALLTDELQKQNNNNELNSPILAMNRERWRELIL